ncbi:zinc finger protein 425-like [Nilaparvata lugens]|uniref:zinc finger protein 425-like n=1 Tax=Nilaparvata lugens TaxID=108931 RepID=UPI00193E8BCF|nr:zinc finger protein 425-like [Nilaparvata lugens]
MSKLCGKEPMIQCDSCEADSIIVDNQVRYPCFKCHKTFKWKSYRAAHLRKQCSGNEPQYQCEGDISFSGSDGIRYQCVKCNRTYKNKYDRNKHMNTQCGKEPKFHCRFTRGDVVTQDGRFPCPKCGTTYKHKYSRDYHVKNYCGKEPKYCCKLCNYKSKWSSDLKNHVVFKHDTNTLNELISIAEDHEQRYPCPRCGTTYKHRYSRDYHVKNFCGLEPKFKCKLCDYRTKRISDLKSHTVSKHSSSISF